MTPIIAALLARELVDRSASDGRSHSLRLNAAGEVLAADVKARIITHEARFMRDLDPAERVVLLEQLRKVGGRRL
jgi:DNA-binding MarR family transcriptional regulator